VSLDEVFGFDGVGGEGVEVALETCVLPASILIDHTFLHLCEFRFIQQLFLAEISRTLPIFLFKVSLRQLLHFSSRYFHLLFLNFFFLTFEVFLTPTQRIYFQFLQDNQSILHGGYRHLPILIVRIIDNAVAVLAS
jgi:hypothetical protein